MSYIGPLDYMRELYGEPIGIGRHRTVFRDGNWVYKVPHDEEGWGMASNDREAQGALWSDEPERFANCELVVVQDFQLLKMEYVTPASHLRGGWTDFIDCGQVGYTKDGRLVAYDWGY